MSVLLLGGTAEAQGKAELPRYSHAAFKLTKPGGKKQFQPRTAARRLDDARKTCKVRP